MKGYQRKLAQEILEFKALKEKYLKGPSTPGDATDDLEKAPDPLWGSLWAPLSHFMPSFYLSTQLVVQYLSHQSSHAQL